MTNQERNREALIDHIAEQDSIIRRRNERIAEVKARGDELARELAHAATRADKAEVDLAEYRAMHSKQIKTIARLQKAAQQPLALTADDITDEMIQRGSNARSNGGAWSRRLVLNILTAALTEPTRPEEKVERVLHRYWSGDINGDDLADRIVEEMNR